MDNFKPDDKGDFKPDDKGIFKPDDKGVFKPDDKGFGGLLGRSNGSGGGGLVVVSFVGPAGVDVRNLAAGILFGNQQRRPRPKGLGNAAADALAEARKAQSSKINISKEISEAVKRYLISAGVVGLAQNATKVSAKSAVKANGKIAAKTNGRGAAKLKAKSAAYTKGTNAATMTDQS
jgi:hypothetical protein